MKIGKVAQRAGLSVSAVRYYERLGLLPEAPRAPSGYRRFEPEVLRRLGFIQRAQALGFSLDEIRELLELRSAPGASAAAVRSLAQEKLARIEAKLADLERMRRALLQVIGRCGGGAAASDCPILDALEGVDEGEAASASPAHEPVSGASPRRARLTVAAVERPHTP